MEQFEMEFQGKVAVITGASKGIGQACAVLFARAGANVAFTYGKDTAGAEETVQLVRDTGREAFFQPADAKDATQNDAFMQAVYDRFGRVDVLVNNVGGADTTPNTGFADMPMGYWHAQFQKNFFAAVQYSQWALKSMIPNKGGSIVNIGSVHTTRVINLNVMPYSCAKQALNQLTRNLAVELAPYHIRVNTVSPGLVKTALTINRYDQEWWSKVTEKIPLHRAGEAVEIAETVFFLASKRSSYITGQIIGVDGGRSL